jgi:alpha-1,6-mannosyltransferase
MDEDVRRALDLLRAARKQLRAHPLPALAAAGFVLCTVIVLAGARVEAGRPTTPLVDWLGLQHVYGTGSPTLFPAVVLLAAVVSLVALWVTTSVVVRLRRITAKHVWWLFVAQAAPLAVGPPLFGTTAYTYAAYGLLQRGGRDPYRLGPAALGPHPVVAAIEPAARDVPSSAGPLGSLLQHVVLAASNGSALGAVIILRVLALLTAIWIGRLAADLAPKRAASSITLTALNPLVLLYVISAARLDGLLVAALLLTVAAARRGHWFAAVAASAVGGCVLPQGLLAVPFVIAVHLFGRGTTRAGRRRLATLGADALVAAAVIAAANFAIPDGFGWVRAIAHQFGTHTPFGAASVIGAVLAPAVPDASYDDLFASGAVAALTAGVCVLGYLLLTVRRRPLPRSVGYALLAAALLGLTLQPWYLLWGTAVLAPAATGPRRRWVLALTGIGAVLNPPGFSDTVGARVTAGLVVVAALGWWVWRRRSTREGDDPRTPRRHRGDVARLGHLRWPGRRDVDEAQHGLEHGDRLDHRQRGAQTAPDAAAERDPRGRRQVLP